MEKSAAKSEGKRHEGTSLDVLASVAMVCLVQSSNLSGPRRCEQCGSVSIGYFVNSPSVTSSPDDKDSETSFQESESPTDYQLLGCSKAISV